MTHLHIATGGAAAALLAGMLTIPFLAAATGQEGMADCPLRPTPAVSDGSPTIVGPSTLTVAQLVDWWDATRGDEPERLTIGVRDAIVLYVSEGNAEGIRGDLVLAQSIVETGNFTNTDTSINNFAGIGHYDNRASGYAYPDARTGIRAQVQLLAKFAGGNDIELVNPDLGLTAGRHATTWAGLAGTWATATNYWDAIRGVYASMLAHHGLDPDTIAPAVAPCSSAIATLVADDGRAYAVPVAADQFNPNQLDDPHHDYPAWDLIIPTGTPVHAVTGGTIARTTNWPRNWWSAGCTRDATGCQSCGVGVTIQSDNGVRHTYCHLSAHAPGIIEGAAVEAGQQLGLSGDTGRSGTPHLHLELRIDGTQYCPQPILADLYVGQTGPFQWTTQGCTF